MHRRSCALWPQEGLSQRTAHSAAGMVPESPLCWGDRLPLSKAGRHLTLHPTRPAPGFQCDPAAPAPSLFAKTGVSPRAKLNTHGPWWRTALSPLPEVFLLERGPPGPPRESRVPPLSCGRWSSFLSISSQGDHKWWVRPRGALGLHPPPPLRLTCHDPGPQGGLPSLWTRFQNLFCPLLCLQLRLSPPPCSQTHTSISFLLGLKALYCTLQTGKLGQGVGVGTEVRLPQGSVSVPVSLKAPGAPVPSAWLAPRPCACSGSKCQLPSGTTGWGALLAPPSCQTQLCLRAGERLRSRSRGGVTGRGTAHGPSREPRAGVH